jgi:hypothetical protein
VKHTERCGFILSQTVPPVPTGVFNPFHSKFGKDLLRSLGLRIVTWEDNEDITTVSERILVYELVFVRQRWPKRSLHSITSSGTNPNSHEAGKRYGSHRHEQAPFSHQQRRNGPSKSPTRKTANRTNDMASSHPTGPMRMRHRKSSSMQARDGFGGEQKQMIV